MLPAKSCYLFLRVCWYLGDLNVTRLVSGKLPKDKSGPPVREKFLLWEHPIYVQRMKLSGPKVSGNFPRKKEYKQKTAQKHLNPQRKQVPCLWFPILLLLVRSCVRSFHKQHILLPVSSCKHCRLQSTRNKFLRMCRPWPSWVENHESLIGQTDSTSSNTVHYKTYTTLLFQYLMAIKHHSTLFHIIENHSSPFNREAKP